jgi:hypothetical protein
MSDLKVGTYSFDEWNEQVMPLVESGKITEEKPKRPAFLMAYQQFSGVLIDRGRRYRCVGWSPPQGKPYVEVRVERYETY